MDTLTLILILLMIIALFLILKNTILKPNIKPEALKKSELIDMYKQQVIDLQKTHKDSANYSKEKIKLLKEINFQLSQNIFFSKEEAHQLIQELSSM